MESPPRITFDDRTALLVVDVQNDFADPAGSLYVRGGEEVVAAANRLIEAAERAGATIAYTQDWHPPVTPHFQKDGGIWPVHCVAGTWGAQLHPELRVAGHVVRKGSGGEDGYSGFSMRDPTSGTTTSTALEGLLREAGTQRVLIAGLATDYCVVSTALDARRLGFEAIVVGSAIAAVDLQVGDGERAIERMRHDGVTVLDDVLRAGAAGESHGSEGARTPAAEGSGH